MTDAEAHEAGMPLSIRAGHCQIPAPHIICLSDLDNAY